MFGQEAKLAALINRNPPQVPNEQALVGELQAKLGPGADPDKLLYQIRSSRGKTHWAVNSYLRDVMTSSAPGREDFQPFRAARATRAAGAMVAAAAGLPTCPQSSRSKDTDVTSGSESLGGSAAAAVPAAIPAAGWPATHHAAAREAQQPATHCQSGDLLNPSELPSFASLQDRQSYGSQDHNTTAIAATAEAGTGEATPEATVAGSSITSPSGRKSFSGGGGGGGGGGGCSPGLDCLPLSLLEAVCRHLDYRSLCAAAISSRALCMAASAESLWSALYNSRWGNLVFPTELHHGGSGQASGPGLGVEVGVVGVAEAATAWEGVAATGSVPVIAGLKRTTSSSWSGAAAGAAVGAGSDVVGPSALQCQEQQRKRLLQTLGTGRSIGIPVPDGDLGSRDSYPNSDAIPRLRLGAGNGGGGSGSRPSGHRPAGSPYRVTVIPVGLGSGAERFVEVSAREATGQEASAFQPPPLAPQLPQPLGPVSQPLGPVYEDDTDRAESVGGRSISAGLQAGESLWQSRSGPPLQPSAALPVVLGEVAAEELASRGLQLVVLREESSPADVSGSGGDRGSGHGQDRSNSAATELTVASFGGDARFCDAPDSAGAPSKVASPVVGDIAAAGVTPAEAVVVAATRVAATTPTLSAPPAGQGSGSSMYRLQYRRQMSFVTSLRCPRCGGGSIIPIVYGFPSPKLLEGMRQHRLILGGDHLIEDCHVWGCNRCGASFRHFPYDRCETWMSELSRPHPQWPGHLPHYTYEL